jgi:hypothetical protein
MINQIMIPVAAFAVTVTGASAFNSDMLSKIDVDLTDSQVSALEVAHEMRTDGSDRDEVKTFLEDAGLDKDTMKEIKDATQELRDEQRAVVQAAVDNNDYEAFTAAIADTPLAEAINSEADFATFVAAQELQADGDREGAAALMTDLGIEKPVGHGGRDGGMKGGGMRGGNEAVQTAVEAGDYNTFVTAIADTPLADAIDSEADFTTFVEAQELMNSGDREGAQALMSDLGIEKPKGRGHTGEKSEGRGMGGEMRGERGGPNAE